MNQNLVSYVFTDQDFTAVKQKISELETMVNGFAIELHIDDKRALGILGDRSLPFTDHTYMLVTERKDFIPPYVNMEEFKKDLDLYKKCKELTKMVEIVHERLIDTSIAAGSDAFCSARKIYNYIKGLVRINMPGVNVVFDELKKRYKKVKDKEEVDNNTASSPSPGKKVTAAADSEEKEK